MNNNEGTTWWAMGLDNSQFESDVAKSNNLFRSIGNTADTEGARIDSIFRKVTVAATGFFTAQQALSYANKMATVRGEFQKLEVAFETMLGNKQKADALMAQVVDTAARTPFDLQGVASGAKQLLAYGVASEEVTDRLVQLGNIAAGLSIPLNDIVYLYGTTMVQGRLFTQDVRQFMGRGIPLVKELSKELGKTEEEINAMVTAGKIGFPEVQKVLDNMTKAGGQFFNLMDKQSQTISGKIANLGDAIETMFNNLGKSQEGIINTVIDGASTIVENYEAVGSTLGELIVAYGAYKAVLIAIAATQKAVSSMKAGAEAEELAKLLTVEQQAVISKKNLVRGSAEYVAAVQAEVAANAESLKSTLLKARTEVVAASQMVAAKRKEYIESKQLVATRTAELATAQATGKAKAIESAQRKLAAAETARETATIQFQAATRDFHAKKLAVENTAKVVNNSITAANTAAKSANIAVTNVLSTAYARLAVIGTKLNAVIMANPWTIAAAAVAALGYAIYKLITYQTDAEKAQSKLNDTINESNRSIDSERLQIDAMFARMKVATKGTEEYKAAKDAIMSTYGSYLKGLGDEKTALDNLALAYKTVTKEAAKSARARAMDVAVKDASDTYAEKKGDVRSEIKKLLDKKFKGQKDEEGMSLSKKYFSEIVAVIEGEADITKKEVQEIISQFDKEVYRSTGGGMFSSGGYFSLENDLKDELNKIAKAKRIYENTIEDAKDKFGENPNSNKKENEEPEVFSPDGKRIKEIEDAIVAGQEKLNEFKKALNDNNGLLEDGTSVTDEAVATQQKYVDSLKKAVLERENELKIIREVEERIDQLKKEQKETVKGSKEYDDLQARINELGKRVPDTKTSKTSQKDYSDEIKKNAQDEIRIKKDMEFAVRQAEIDSQKDSFSKTMEQNQLNYEQEMEQIKRQKEDKLNKIQEWEKTIWESQGKKGKFTPKTTELSEDDKNQFKDLEKAAGDKLVLSNQSAIDSMLKQYQTYTDKRKELEEKLQKDVAAMRDANDKAKLEGKSPVFSDDNIAQAEQNTQEALNTLDQEIASREASFTVWADKMANLGLKQLRAALQTARDALDKDGGTISEKEKAVLRAKIKTLEKKLEIAEAEDADLSASDKVKRRWDSTLKTMNEVQETVDNICNSFDGLDEATKVALSAATNIAGGTIAMIMGIQQLAIMAAEQVKGVERASVILAVVGAAIQIMTALFSMTSKAEKEHQETLKEVAASKLKMQHEYNLLLMEQNLLMKEATSIFGEDQIAKAVRSIEVYRDAIDKFKETLKGVYPERNKFEQMFKQFTNREADSYLIKLENFKTGMGAVLNDIQIKTGSYTTGAWFWKKQHDVMTPVLEVYKDLVTEEGNLDIARAKAIMDAHEMSDASKEQLQALIELQEQAEKAQEELRSYLQDTFGSLGDGIMDSITAAIENNGISAWEKFGEAGSSVLEDLGKQIAYSLFFSDKFKKLQADLEKIYGSGKTEEEIAKDARDLVSSFYNGISSDMENAQNWMQEWKEEANKQGLDLWSSTREGSSKGIATASQETVSELNGRATAIQGHTYTISEGMKELTHHSAKALEYLSGIQNNTAHLEAIGHNISTMNNNLKR
ncbi:tape measure protein [Parabacteroides sp. PF5-9]|uniref:tape measure protein n=1 Tax=Parabacteroides sp. PF5-9 TaxID=1742404 RepID=UPI0024739FB7|nr:tape measure protein [Parabacteroides sp. PF5-9]MDH6357630.1 tape measure domain-containing protein [Parabacteroides sp. PF5-9]